VLLPNRGEHGVRPLVPIRHESLREKDMPTETELMQQSQFVFRGTVQKLKAVTMASVPATDDMAVVRVDEVFKAPETLGDWTNREITVQLATTGDLEEGEQFVFYTNGWLYGDSLAVREVGRWAVTATISRRLSAKSARMAQQAASEELRRHIAEAELVVVGRVLDTSPVLMGTAGILSEHDPDWWQATIEVESVEKGDRAPGALTVVYPRSMDVMWAHVPKLEVGQEGIWILKTGEVAGLRAEEPVVQSPLDFLDRDRLGQIRALIAQ
jgi:hypothetical protein